MSYIIKNCPCYNNERFIGGFLDDKATFCTYYGKKCQGCTDCVLKQIAEKCKKEITTYRNTLLPDDGTNTLHFGRQSFAYDILQLLDIQEIE